MIVVFIGTVIFLEDGLQRVHYFFIRKMFPTQISGGIEASSFPNGSSFNKN